jgi:hypothetical protein
MEAPGGCGINAAGDQFVSANDIRKSPTLLVVPATDVMAIRCDPVWVAAREKHNNSAVSSSSQGARRGKRTEPPANKSLCAITRERSVRATKVKVKVATPKMISCPRRNLGRSAS